MACNAWNHRDDCQCNFKGGRINSHPPQNSKWVAKSYRSYLRENYRTCEKCGATVFYIRFQNGGGALFSRLGRPWKKHGCFIAEGSYSPFSRNGIPRLTALKSEYEKDGWAPVFDIRIEIDMIECLIIASSLDRPNVLRFAVNADPQIDTTAPSYFRGDPHDRGLAKIDYFDAVTGAPRSITVKWL